MGAIGTGFLVLLGIGPNGTQAGGKKPDKICGLRVFCRRGREDEFEPGRRGRALLVVSQVHPVRRYQEPPARVHQGRAPAVAIPLYETFLDLCRARGFQVEHGEFGADMAVQSVNDAPSPSGWTIPRPCDAGPMGPALFLSILPLWGTTR